MANPTVILEWIVSPPNYFEDGIETRLDGYVLSILDGKVV
jgi:hypothetical protein